MEFKILIFFINSFVIKAIEAQYYSQPYYYSPSPYTQASANTYSSPPSTQNYQSSPQSYTTSSTKSVVLSSEPRTYPAVHDYNRAVPENPAAQNYNRAEIPAVQNYNRAVTENTVQNYNLAVPETAVYNRAVTENSAAQNYNRAVPEIGEYNPIAEIGKNYNTITEIARKCCPNPETSTSYPCPCCKGYKAPKVNSRLLPPPAADVVFPGIISQLPPLIPAENYNVNTEENYRKNPDIQNSFNYGKTEYPTSRYGKSEYPDFGGYSRASESRQTEYPPSRFSKSEYPNFGDYSRISESSARPIKSKVSIDGSLHNSISYMDDFLSSLGF